VDQGNPGNGLYINFGNASLFGCLLPLPHKSAFVLMRNIIDGEKKE
jgi:hypothetical protein